MIEFDINPRIEKELLKILKGRTKKFLKYLEENNVDIEDNEELLKVVEEFEQEENKSIFGINKVLLVYTLALVVDGISRQQREKFKQRIQHKLFREALKEADRKVKELYIGTIKRSTYHLEKYIDELRKSKSKASIEDFEERLKGDLFKDRWEEARQRVEERMGYSDLINSNNVLGEIQAEYVKVIMEELRIKGFIWITKHDERVREKHSWRHGKLFDTNGNLLRGTGKDSSRILPKQEWGCRCKMGIDEKVIEEALKDVS